MIKFLCKLAHKFWWIPWSNFRYRKVERHNVACSPEDRAYSEDTIRKLASKMYGKFQYTSDGVDKLWDAVCPPPYAYSTISKGEKLRDDCDGFHSLMYHCLDNGAIKPFLMTVNARGAGHCVLVFYFDLKWYVLDYTTLYVGQYNLELAIESYNKTFKDKYGAKSKVYSNLFLKYSYNKGKFRLVNPEKGITKV